MKLGVTIAVLIGVSVFALGAARQLFLGTDDAPVDLRHTLEVTIDLGDMGFDPRDIIIKRGTRVTFTTSRDNKFWPASNAHPLHDLYPQLDAERPLEADETWSFTFESPGTWGYHDHIRSYYTGVIYVE